MLLDSIVRFIVVVLVFLLIRFLTKKGICFFKDLQQNFDDQIFKQKNKGGF